VYDIRKYQTAGGVIPFDQWMEGLRNIQARARILVRLDRLQKGLLGDWKSVGEGVYELRIDYGPGYRVYYAKEGSSVILLLCGGDKSTQQVNVARAQQYLQDHHEEIRAK
jgi:putative addiction module killer protein